MKGIIPVAIFSGFFDRGENDSDSDRSIVDNSNDTFEQQSGLQSLHTLQLSSSELSGSFPILSIFTSTATANATARGSSSSKILQLEDNHITAGLDDATLRCHLVPSSMNT